MKRTIFLLVAIIAFLLPIGLTSCEDDVDVYSNLTLTGVKNDPVLKTFLSDGNYPKETLIANYDSIAFVRRTKGGGPIVELSMVTAVLVGGYDIQTEISDKFKGKYNFRVFHDSYVWSGYPITSESRTKLYKNYTFIDLRDAFRKEKSTLNEQPFKVYVINP